MKTLCSFLLLLALASSFRSMAAGAFVEAGAHLGGDTLVEVSFTDGSTESLKAGQLISLAVGWHTELSETLSSRISLGYKFDSITAQNGDIEFTRVPLELLLLTQNGSWLVGGGVTYHMSPKFTADAATIGLLGTAKLDDALGFVLAADYNTHGIFDREWYIGARITVVDYENNLGSVSGSSIGVVIGYLF